jgi:hypothetical protein
MRDAAVGHPFRGDISWGFQGEEHPVRDVLRRPAFLNGTPPLAMIRIHHDHSGE